MKRKWMFIFAVILAVAAGFAIYIERHGAADVLGTDVGISAG